MLGLIVGLVMIPTIVQVLYVIKLFIWDAMVMGVVKGLTE